MRLIDLKEAKTHLSQFVDEAQRDRILITRRGKPAALVIGVEGQNMEQVLMGNDVEFWRMLEERRKRPATLTSDDIRRSFGIQATPKRRRLERVKRRATQRNQPRTP